MVAYRAESDSSVTRDLSSSISLVECIWVCMNAYVSMNTFVACENISTFIKILRRGAIVNDDSQSEFLSRFA